MPIQDAVAAARGGSRHHLGVVEMRVHPGRLVREPRPQVTSTALGVRIVSGEAIGEAESFHPAHRIDQALLVVPVAERLRIQLPVASDVGQAVLLAGVGPEVGRHADVVADDPSCAPGRPGLVLVDDRRRLRRQRLRRPARAGAGARSAEWGRPAEEGRPPPPALRDAARRSHRERPPREPGPARASLTLPRPRDEQAEPRDQLLGHLLSPGSAQTTRTRPGDAILGMVALCNKRRQRVYCATLRRYRWLHGHRTASMSAPGAAVPSRGRQLESVAPRAGPLEDSERDAAGSRAVRSGHGIRLGHRSRARRRRRRPRGREAPGRARRFRAIASRS